jgi:hypothetical protein
MAELAIVALIGASEVSATMVFAAVAEAGTIMSVVGAVTGDKELGKIGGAMAMVGGIGGMATGAFAAAGSAAAGPVTECRRQTSILVALEMVA